MNVKKRFLIGTLAATLLTTGGLGVAAEQGATAHEQTRQSASGMHNMPGMHGRSMGGMMQMMNMMSNCPMMGSNLPPRQQMRMHADMMRAMANIMDKYAAQAPATRHP